MSGQFSRREFLGSLTAAAALGANAKTTNTTERCKIETFDYSNVRLHASRFRSHYEATRDFYFGLNEADLVHGFRVEAGLPAPGKGLDGWCRKDSSVVFGQWLSGMARMAKAGEDYAMRDKAARLMHAWSETFAARPRASKHYPFDKMVCGLLDMHLYTGNPDALPLLKKLTETARTQLGRTRSLASPKDQQAAAGDCEEWYTLSENLYRAFLVTGDELYKDFGDVWRYEAYWSRFADTAKPEPLRVHAYSHVNSFSSAAMTYQATGDERYLRIARNAYDFVEQSQMFAAGGYGPGERLVGYDGELGRALELHADTAASGCGTWSGFKLARYLMSYTGEARYGDWIERLLYNGIGAALPMAGEGETFYYSDYRIGSGTKYYLWDHWPCCSGTHIQDVADYYNVLYLHDEAGLYVNQFVPSEVTWARGAEQLRLRLQTEYPASERIEMRLAAEKPVKAAIRVRIPNWAEKVTIRVNGIASVVDASGGEWAAVEREWHDGDRIEMRVPMSLRAEEVDAQHPHRLAILYGPVVLVEDLRFNLGLRMLPGHHSTEELQERLRPMDQPLHFRVVDPPGQVVHSGGFFPYWEAKKDLPYRMYHDFSKA
jgi:DUF1680 family protein